jgi:bacteriorhodopsin
MLSLLEISFYSSFLFLSVTSVLTSFEVFNNFPQKYLPLKYILTIETAVNIIASFAYSYLLILIKNPNFTNITIFRYLDWFITTPLLLLSFILYLQYLKNQKHTNNDNISTIEIDYHKLFIIIILNIFMLIFGILGETGKINHIIGCLLGFIPFFAMFYLIWKWYGDYNSNKNIFTIFIIIWSLYGVIYFLPNIPKNISYNILDIIAKVGFGLLIWFEVVNLRLQNKISNTQDIKK